MLGPVVEMLGQPVGGGHIRKLRGRAERGPVVGEHARRRVGLNLGMQHVHRGRFERFVMLRERPFRHRGAGEQAPDAFGIHDERTDSIGRFRGRRIVWHVDAGPACAIPLDHRLGLVPGFSGQVRTSAVVEDSPICRPGPGPVGRDTLLARVRGVAPRHLVTLLRKAAGKDPAAGCGGAVIAQLRECVEQLAGAQRYGTRIVPDVGQGPAVHVLGELLRIGVRRIGIVPGQIQDRVGKRAALRAVHFTHAMEYSGYNPDIRLGLARWLSGLPVPLQPAGRVDQRAVLLGEACCRQLEDLGLDAGRVGRILRPEILPEAGGLRIQRVHDDEEFQFSQCRADLAAVREGLHRVEALADIAVHLAVRHHFERANDIVHRNVELRQPVIGPVIVGPRGVTVYCLLEADGEFPVVLPVARLTRAQRLELPRLHILLEGSLVVFR